MEKVVDIPCQARGKQRFVCEYLCIFVQECQSILSNPSQMRFHTEKCNATLTSSAGVPQPDIVWYKDALPIDPVKMPRYRVLVGGSLQVNGLLPDDTGMFQCFARNLAGEVQTNTYLAVTSECSSGSSQNPFQ